MKILTAPLGVLLMIGAAYGQAADAPLQAEAKIELGSVAGRIDHMAIDRARGRLFVAELGNNSVGVVDLDQRKVIHRITGLSEPQGIGYLAAADMAFVANGGDGVVHIYKGADYAPAGTIALGEDADNIRIDDSANRVIVGYGRGALALIDGGSKRKVADLVVGPPGKLPDHPSRRPNL